MTIFETIYRFLQAAWQALLDLIQPLVMPDWGWVISVVLPLGVAALVLIYFGYLFVLYRRNAAANVDRRPRRLAARPSPPRGVHAQAPSWWPVALSVGFFFALLGLAVGQLALLSLGLLVTLGGAWGWLRSANREWRRAELGMGHEAGATLEAGTASAAVVPPARALVPLGPTAVVAPMGYEPAHGPEPPAGVHMPSPSWWPVYASAAAFFALLGLAVFDVALIAGGLVLGLLAFAGWYRDAYRELKVAEGTAPRPHARDPLAVFPRILAPLGALTVIVSIAFAVGPSLIGGAFPPAQPTGSAAPPAATTLRITAIPVQKYDLHQLTAAANEPLTIDFDNSDPGQTHDVAIKDPSGKVIFTGKVVTGPTKTTYSVDALPAGAYEFFCVVHPYMKGTLTVVAGPAGGSPAPAGGASPSPGS